MILAIKSIMKLLQSFLPKDKNGFCEIETCYYLEFGRINDQELMTAEDLYDRLISKKTSHGRKETKEENT
jgi:hypothetical protein